MFVFVFFFFSSRRRHTRCSRDWSSDVCSSDLMSERKAEMIEMRPSGGGRLRLVFLAPTRGLIGYLGELLTDTRGTAIMNRLFHNWGQWKGDIAGRRNGVLISNESGE